MLELILLGQSLLGQSSALTAQSRAVLITSEAGVVRSASYNIPSGRFTTKWSSVKLPAGARVFDVSSTRKPNAVWILYRNGETQNELIALDGQSGAVISRARSVAGDAAGLWSVGGQMLLVVSQGPVALGSPYARGSRATEKRPALRFTTSTLRSGERCLYLARAKIMGSSTTGSISTYRWSGKLREIGIIQYASEGPYSIAVTARHAVVLRGFGFVDIYDRLPDGRLHSPTTTTLGNEYWIEAWPNPDGTLTFASYQGLQKFRMSPRRQLVRVGSFLRAGLPKEFVRFESNSILSLFGEKGEIWRFRRGAKGALAILERRKASGHMIWPL